MREDERKRKMKEIIEATKSYTITQKTIRERAIAVAMAEARGEGDNPTAEQVEADVNSDTQQDLSSRTLEKAVG